MKNVNSDPLPPKQTPPTTQANQSKHGTADSQLPSKQINTVYHRFYLFHISVCFILMIKLKIKYNLRLLMQYSPKTDFITDY